MLFKGGYDILILQVSICPSLIRKEHRKVTGSLQIKTKVSGEYYYASPHKYMEVKDISDWIVGEE